PYHFPVPRVPITPSPAPSLFPYTTLFRSGLHARVRERPAGNGALRARDLRAPGPAGRAALVADAERDAGGGAGRRLALAARTGQDRKSTRLNSSHVAISYAVFCLKKKTKN